MPILAHWDLSFTPTANARTACFPNTAMYGLGTAKGHMRPVAFPIAPMTLLCHSCTREKRSTRDHAQVAGSSSGVRTQTQRSWSTVRGQPSRGRNA